MVLKLLKLSRIMLRLYWDCSIVLIALGCDYIGKIEIVDWEK